MYSIQVFVLQPPIQGFWYMIYDALLQCYKKSSSKIRSDKIDNHNVLQLNVNLEALWRWTTPTQHLYCNSKTEYQTCTAGPMGFINIQEP
jgi:hypothetical protein